MNQEIEKKIGKNIRSLRESRYDTRNPCGAVAAARL